jgi:hypothetical protein
MAHEGEPTMTPQVAAATALQPAAVTALQIEEDLGSGNQRYEPVKKLDVMNFIYPVPIKLIHLRFIAKKTANDLGGHPAPPL